MRAVTEISHTRHNLVEWARFIRSEVHILCLEPQLLLQQALNLPDQHPVSAAASKRFHDQGSTRSVVRWINKPQASDPVLITLNTGTGRYCRFSPTGARLLTWASHTNSEPGDAALWDVDNGRLLGSWSATRVSEPRFVSLSDAKHGFALLGEGTLRLYDADSGADLQTLAKAPAGVRTCSVASGARRVAFGSEDGTVKVIDVASGSEPFTLPAHEGPIELCMFVLEGRRLITRDKLRVRLFDAESGSMLLDLPDRDGYIFDHFEVSADERWMALEEKNKSEGKGWTTLWETETGRRGLPVTGSRQAIRTWGLSPDGQHVLAIEFERGEVTRALLELWGVHSNAKESTLYLGWLSPYPPVRFSADGRWLAAGRSQPTEPGDIELWDLQSRSEKRAAHFQGHSTFVEDLDFSMDGRTLASIDSDGVVRIWSLPVESESTQGVEQARHPTEVEACGFTPDGRTLISICSEVQGFQHGENFSGATKLVTVNAAEIRLWDAETGASMQRLDAGHQQPSCLAFSSDSQHLAISSRRFGGDPIRIWNRNGMISVAELRGHRSAVGICGYTRDGRRIVSMGFSTFRSRPEDNALRIWDPITGIEIATLIGHAGELAGFDISPNGRFAVASSDVVASAVKTPGVIADTKGDFFDALSGPLLPVDLFLWDLDKRAKCASLEECFRPSFSPDGKAVIAISGGDEWAVLWQFASADATTSTTPVRSGVSAARFTPDGRELALALPDGTVAFVDPTTGHERLRLCRAGEKVGLGLFSRDGKFMVERTVSTVRVWNVGSGEQVAVFPAPADLKCVAIGADITKLAIGDKLGGVSLLGVSGIQPGASIVTATRTWRFGSHGTWRRRFGFFSTGKMDARPTVLCPLCEAAFVPDSRIIDAIESIAREADLTADAAPAIALPRDAWDEPRLLSSCERCGAALKINPFIA